MIIGFSEIGYVLTHDIKYTLYFYHFAWKSGKILGVRCQIG